MASNTPWIWHSVTTRPMTTDDPDNPNPDPVKLKIIIPVTIVVIIVVIGIGLYFWYRKRKKKAQETIEVPETKIRLSLLGTQYQISNEVSRQSSSSSTEFREKALVDSELEQTDNESAPVGMQYMVLPLQESKHGSTYLYQDNLHSRRSTRSSQDFSMSDIVSTVMRENLVKSKRII